MIRRLIAVSLIVVVGSTAETTTTLGQSPEFMAAYNPFESFYQQGRFSAAVLYAENLVFPLAREEFAPNDPLAATFLKNLAGLWRSLAEQGEFESQQSLGAMYFTGIGVPQDYSEAAKWFRLAAEQGVAMSQSSLGWMYQQGLGVPQDYAEAAKWYGEAAEQNFGEAQNNLGYMYMEGLAVPKDNVRALMYYELSAANGDRFAAEDAAGNAYLIKQRMGAEEVEDAGRLVREWRQKYAPASPFGSGQDETVPPPGVKSFEGTIELRFRPVEDFAYLWSARQNFGRTKRGWLGVRIQKVLTDEMAESLGLDRSAGALVASVAPNGPAEAGGVEADDVILSFNGRPIDKMRDLAPILADTDIGRSVPVEVWRRGEVHVLSVEVGELDEELRPDTEPDRLLEAFMMDGTVRAEGDQLLWTYIVSNIGFDGQPREWGRIETLTSVWGDVEKVKILSDSVPPAIRNFKSGSTRYVDETSFEFPLCCLPHTPIRMGEEIVEWRRVEAGVEEGLETTATINARSVATGALTKGVRKYLVIEHRGEIAFGMQEMTGQEGSITGYWLIDLSSGLKSRGIKRMTMAAENLKGQSATMVLNNRVQARIVDRRAAAQQ